MQTITLGSTGIVAQRNGFGALPIQRDDKDTAVRLLRKAYAHGVNYFDTARAYTDSEEKIGAAFGDMGVRDRIYIATKTMAKDTEGFWRDLETSLRMLRTDCLHQCLRLLTPQNRPVPCPVQTGGTSGRELVVIVCDDHS